MKFVAKLKQAGIPLGIGTDLIGNDYQSLPAPYISELKQFVKLGYTSSEVLSIATRDNARLLDMGDRLGSLETGKLADVLVVAGQPDTNLDDLANVKIVIRDGYTQVENGRLFLPRHVASPMPEPKKN